MTLNVFCLYWMSAVKVLANGVRLPTITELDVTLLSAFTDTK
jgi:hypothetical protein